MKIRTGRGMTVVLVTAILLAACSGGGGSGGGSMPTPVLSQGVMVKGSVIVNGVRFEDTAANITGDDTAKTPADLKDGMVVKVKGRRNDDGVTGTADRIEIENEVRGTVTSVGTGTFGVLGQTVIVTSATITAGGWSYDPATGAITGLSGPFPFVEVHGSRNAAGNIVATRVEKFGAAGIDELRGIVTGLTPTPFAAGTSTFNIGPLAILTTVSTAIVPTGAVVQEGTLVEVHLIGGNTATRIEVEDAEDAEFEPAEGQEVEVEGFVENYDGTDFDLAGVHVHTTGSTRYEDGIKADLMDNAKVEAEGHMAGGVLWADKIKFKDTIRIEANLTSTNPLTALGLAIYTTAGTESIGGPFAVSDGIRLRGFLNRDGSITATRIEKQGSVAADKNILQGVVTAKSGGVSKATSTLTIAGITISLASVPDAELKDDNDNMLTLSQFYAAITLDRTAVKVRGTYSGGVGGMLAADKAEIE